MIDMTDFNERFTALLAEAEAARPKRPMTMTEVQYALREVWERGRAFANVNVPNLRHPLLQGNGHFQINDRPQQLGQEMLYDPTCVEAEWRRIAVPYMAMDPMAQQEPGV